MQLTPTFPPPTVIMKHGIAVESRMQQWLWGNNNKEHRAAWPLPLLAANQSLAPISEHVPRAKLTPHAEQERRRGGIWFSHMTGVRISLPTTRCSPTSPSQRAFPNTSTLILSHPVLSFFIVLGKKKKKLVSFALHWRKIHRLPYVALGILSFLLIAAYTYLL